MGLLSDVAKGTNPGLTGNTPIISNPFLGAPLQNRLNGGTPAPAPAPAPAAPAPPVVAPPVVDAPVAPTPSPISTTPIPYVDTDPLGTYFKNNPSAGDAWNQLKATLDTYGLSDLYSFVQQGIVTGWSATEAYQRIRETDPYKVRFAGNATRAANGMQPLSETDYINTEKSYRQALDSAGIDHFNTQNDFAKFIGADISAPELQTRVQKGYEAAQSADPQTRLALQSMYGISDGDLAAFFLDPTATTTKLLNRFNSAQVAGAASRTGWGSLDVGSAEGLTALGVSGDQAAAGFNKLGSESELFNGLPGQNETSISQQDQIAAQFGQSAAAQKAIKDRAASRLATFSGGGQFVTDKAGASGIGVSQ